MEKWNLMFIGIADEEIKHWKKLIIISHNNRLSMYYGNLRYRDI